MPQTRHDGVRVIAVFKFLKGLLLIGAALGAMHVLHAGSARFAATAFSYVASTVGPRMADKVFGMFSHLTPAKLEGFGIGAALYAVLFLVEGVGLWMLKRWAEYLTIVATGGFIPFEIYELVKSTSLPKIIAIVTNAAVVAYLIWRVRGDRAADRG